MNSEEENRKFLTEKVDPILEKMVADLLVERPNNIVIFSLPKFKE
jgi:hypothetical protein